MFEYYYRRSVFMMRIRPWATMLSGLIVLSGCAGAHIHNATNSALAEEAQKKYKEYNILTVIEIEQRNLDKVLEAELKANQENHAMRLDLALLRIADDDNTPMASTLKKRAHKRIESLNGEGETRKVRTAMSKLSDSEKFLEIDINNITAAGGKKPPPCKKNLPDVLPGSKKDSPANIIYNINYKSQCRRFLENRDDIEHSLVDDSLVDGGEYKEAYNEWLNAKKELNSLNKRIEERRTKVREAADNYTKVFKKVASGDEKLVTDMEKAAESLRQALKAAEGASSALELGVQSEESIKAIDTILQAIVSRQPNEQVKDANLAKATVIASALPGLAGEMKALLDKAQAPTVSNLLIEMRHQQLMLDYAKEQQQLAKKRVDLQKQYFNTLTIEAGHWLDFHNALCNYTAIKKGLGTRGIECDGFKVKVKEENEVKKVSCSHGDNAKLANCALQKPWNLALKETDVSSSKRELYSALAQMSLAVQARQLEDDIYLRIIDLDHRRSIAANRSAIRAWDNLITVPVDQLAAYHASGIKPNEVADMLVKAYGLSAIAVGAAQ